MVRRRLILQLMSILVALGGCIVVPVVYRTGDTRKTVNADAAAFLTTGTTTREEVLLRLGEPEATRDDQRIFIYHWSHQVFILVILLLGGGDADDYRAHDYLRIEFDDDGRVKHHDRPDKAMIDWLLSRP